MARADDPITLPKVLRLFPLQGVVLLPGCLLPLNIFEPRYLNMVDDAMAGDRLIGMIQGDGAGGPLARVGCAGRIASHSETDDGRYLITLTGLCRFAVVGETAATTPYRQAEVDWRPYAADLDDAGGPDPALDREALADLLRSYLQRRGLATDWELLQSAPAAGLISSLAMALPLEPTERQALLEALTPQDRAEALLALLRMDAAAASRGDDAPRSVQ